MNSQNLFRPTDIHDMLERNQLFYTDAAIRAWRAFKPRASDIIIATFPKSGTTWMQQILHTLRTGGDMDFEEISMVVPWMEIAYDMGIDLGAEQPAPRLFKSHLPADQVPPGARYIVIFRNSADVLRSYYEFMDGWFFEPGSISITEFAEYAFFDQSGFEDYWHHLITWWPRRSDRDVLMFCYEDMKEHIDEVINSVANHAGIDLGEELLATTRLHSSHAFMREHASQFDEHATQQALNPICRLPAGGPASKVTTEKKKDERIEIPAAIHRRIEGIWQLQIKPLTGLASYNEMRRAILDSNNQD